MLMVCVAVLLVVAGLIDLPMQEGLFKREQKMGHQELKRELKETIGNPEVRSFRRGEGRRMIEVKPRAEAQPSIMIIGSGLAVGIRYQSGETPVPLVVSRHTLPETDKAIRKARREGIPVYEDAQLSSDLARTIVVGKPIRERHFTSVAQYLVQARMLG